MKTLKYISKTLGFFTSLSLNKKEETVSTNKLELTNPRFGVNFKKITVGEKTPSSLLSLMYSEENNTLFI